MKSHSKQQISDAFANGSEVWFLDTGDDGDDDILIGTEEECWAAISDFFAQDGLEVPQHYTLEKLSAEAFSARF